MTGRFTRNAEAKCGSCPYYTAGTSDEMRRALAGVCHRNPPVSTDRPSPLGPEYRQAVFPITSQFNWCGEHPEILLEIIEAGRGDSQRLKIVDDE